MKSLTTAQAALAARRAASPVPLVTLTTYSDRAAGTVDTIYRFSTARREYDYGNTGSNVTFHPFLQSVSPITRTMDHLPGESAEAEVRIALANLVYLPGGTDRLWTVLRAKNLEFARVEIASVLLDTAAGQDWSALTNLTGNEHVVWFRGVLAQVEGVTNDSIQLRVQSEEPLIPWLLASDPTTNHPEDVGARLPIPVGQAERVPLTRLVVGYETTLAQAIDSTTTGVLKVTDAVGFPTSGSFSVRIDGEEMLCSAASSADRTITVSARGQNGTPAGSHLAGSVVIEQIDEIVLAAADRSVTAINRLYLENPYNRTVYAVPDNQWSANLADSAAITGETISTVRIDQTQLRSILADAMESARVSTQAEYVTSGSVTTTTYTPAAGALNTYRPGPAVLPVAGSTLTGNTKLTYSGSGYGATKTFLTTQGLPSTAVQRWRVVNKVNTSRSVSGFQMTAYLEVYNIPGIANGTVLPVTFTSTQTGLQSATGWVTPPSGTTVATLGTQSAFFIFRWSMQGGTVTSGDYVELASGWGVEVETNSSPTVTRTTNADSRGASQGYGLKWFADVEGVPAPRVWASGYSFDSDSDWTALSGTTRTTDTSVEIEGTGCQKLTCSATAVLALDSDAANWTTTNGTDADEATIKSEGSGSLKLTSNSAVDFCFSNRTLSALDWTDKLLLINVYVEGAEQLSASRGVAVNIGTDGSNNGYLEFGTARGMQADTWMTLIIDPTALDVVYGSPNWANVNQIIFGHNYVNAASGRVTYWDNVRTIPKTLRAQMNAGSSLGDFSADGDEYRIAVRADALDLVQSAEVYFSDTTSSSTTKPAAYSTLSVDRASLSEDEWVTATVEAVDTGSPTVTAVRTLGVTANLRTQVAVPVATVPAVYFDQLQVRDDASNPYGVAVGALLEHPIDVARWIATDLCGGSVDSTTFTAARTSLGTGVVAGLLNGLGTTLRQVMAGLGRECRTNFVREEGASSTVWKALTPDASFAWPASVATLTSGEWTQFVESGRDVRIIGTRFRAFYGVDLSLGGTDERSFGDLLRADPDQNDCTAAIATADLEDAEERYGRRDAAPTFLYLVRDEDTAIDVLGYYATEGVRDAALYLLDLPHWAGLTLERGDVVTLTPPWASVAVDARVIEVTVTLTSPLVSIRVVEVL